MLNEEIVKLLAGDKEIIEDYNSLEEALRVAILKISPIYNYDPLTIENIIRESKLFQRANEELQKLILEYIKEICEQYELQPLLEKEYRKENLKEILKKYLPENEVEEIINSFYPNNEDDDNLEIQIDKTEIGMAVECALHFAPYLKYIAEEDRFVKWDGKRWRRLSKAEAENLVAMYLKHEYEFTQSLIDFVSDKETKQEIEERVKFLNKFQNYEKVKRIINLIKGDKKIHKRIHHFDKDEYIINLQNGVLDLRTLELKPHFSLFDNSKMYITRIANVKYDGNCECPNWFNFLKKILVRDELIEFIQRVAGYILTGSTQENVVFILYGVGANGKSTFIRTFQEILGDYAMTTPGETFLVDGYSKSVRNDLARLQGARLIIVSEIEEDKNLAESLVKQFSGGDTIVARFLYREYFEYKPTGKIFLITNKKPIIRGTEYAIWRRILLIPFEVVIPPNEQIKDYYERFLKPELNGIFKWMVEGYKKYVKQGLNPPEIVKVATEEYKVEMDVIGRFIQDECYIDPKTFILFKDLYAKYERWCEETGSERLSRKKFTQILKDKGFQPDRVHGGRIIKGLNLKENIDLLLDEVGV
jgi:putative DNA primase/helicase